MLPDDPRHGTYAGYEVHKKSKTPQCAACKTAGYRARKRMRMAGPVWTVIGPDAYAVVDATPPSALARATGLSPRTLHRIKTDGPTARVRRDTQRKILEARVVTPIGVTRRLQALGALGWSASEVASRAGLTRWNVAIARSAEDRNFVYASFAEKIAKVYDELAMSPAPPSRAATRQVREALAKGWLTPLAWDDIDDPAERPDVRWRPQRYSPAELEAEWTHLRRAGVSIEAAASQLGITVDAIEKAIERARKAAA